MSERLEILFRGHTRQSLTDEEEVEFMGLCLEPALQFQLQKLVEDAWHEAGTEFGLSRETKQELFQRLFEKEKTPVIDITRSRNNWKRWMVAASIILLFGIIGYFVVYDNKSPKSDEPILVNTDIGSPTTSKAIITLADGRKVYLDSASGGQLALQDNMKLVKLDNGQIAYQTSNGKPVTELKYNTLENPKGSRAINMTMADGSKVWLNAGSSVTYPVAFAGNERKVTISGEAYFEVAHDAAKPFYVSKGNVQVQVLGTHFNVNAYDDEKDIKVTLLEGGVKVKINNQEKILRPGQQAIVANDVDIINDIDLEEVMAWKNGEFNFGEQSDIKTVMRQISRWYDVDVEYRGTVTEKIFGSVSRSENVSKVLQLLERTGGVRFTIEGKKIIVMP